jgi:hypothetical protein
VPGQARFGHRGRLEDAAREREPVERAEEQQPEHDGHAAEDLGDASGVSVEQLADPADRHAEQREHQRETKHEQAGPGNHPPTRHRQGNGRSRDRHGTISARDGHGGKRYAGGRGIISGCLLAAGVHPGHARDIGQIARHQWQAARRLEGNRPGRRRHRHSEQQRPRRDQARNVHRVSPPT